MITIRPSTERGHEHRSWLDSFHTFSFASYYDPRHMGFRALRVINEDFIAGGGGFPMHPHGDMEIVTYVLEGALRHEDSLGSGAVIRAGEVQRITAGSGIEHSEENASRTEAVHLFQIWILPDQAGLTPAYEQRAFPEGETAGRLRVVASPDGRDGSLAIHQDALLFVARLADGQQISYPLARGRHAWVQVASGTLSLNGHVLHAGDGAAVSNEAALALVAQEPAHFLVFDLA